MKETILIVDDDIVLGNILSDILSEAGYRTICAANGRQALVESEKNQVDLVLLDLILPGIDGMEIMKQVIKISPNTVIVIMSGHGTIAKAVEATKLGAYDFIEKPLEKERVLLTVKNALEKLRLIRCQNRLMNEVKQRYNMVAVSQPMQQIFALIDRVAKSNSRVLIFGETGTGKELISRAIHTNSNRSDKPFIQVNCAALPEELVESELFGHVKGSFTGAHRDKIGKFQQAHTGTLFLDEIADLSSRAQAKVLRAIEDGEVARVGSTRQEHVNVRLICATNQNLEDKVEERLFREDLYHRLNVIQITVPPLRQRPDDILPLIHHFMHIFQAVQKFTPKKILPDAEGVLLAYSWPGNVRELQHFVEKMVLLVENDDINSSLVSHLLKTEPVKTDSNNATLQIARDSFERSYILSSLQNNDWKVAVTAEQLGIARTHLYRKMQKLDIQIPEVVVKK